VIALSDIPIEGKMLIAAVGPRWCRHREEMISMCTYSGMINLQLIVSGTLANAGHPERVTNKQTILHGQTLLMKLRNSESPDSGKTTTQSIFEI
jgi:hypothetical protein